jgi:hypothetical protein
MLPFANHLVYDRRRDRRLSRQRVRVVDQVPRVRAQRSPRPAPPAPAEPQTPYYGLTLPDEGIGRLPCIGIDQGAIRGTVPGQRL